MRKTAAATGRDRAHPRRPIDAAFVSCESITQRGAMAAESVRVRVLRAYGVVESGLEPAFDRLARLAVGVTRAPICVLAFGDAPRPWVKGYSGPRDMSPADALPPRDFYDALLAGPSVVASDGEVAGAAIRSESGTTVGVVCARARVPRTWPEDVLDTLVYIAELAQSELAIRRDHQPDQSTARILESITDACVFLDRDWRYTYVNRKAAEIFGRRPQDMIGKHIWTEFPEGVGQPFDLAYRKAMAEQVFIQLEEYYPPYGRWFENRIYPSPTGLAIFFQDVTERRHAEQERSRLATIIETTPDLVAVSDAQGALSYVNRAGRDLLGIGDDAVLANLRLVGLHALPSRPLLSGTAMPAAKSAGAWSGEATLVSANATKISVAERLLWHDAPPPEGGYFSLIARDITEFERAEAQGRRDATVMAQAERMAHLGHWVWDVDENRITWSAELFRIYGLDPGLFEASFEDYLARVHPQDRRRVQQTIEQALRDRKAFTFEERIVRPNGELRYLRSWGQVSSGAEREQTQLFGACLDMTELMLATEGLRRTAEWLEIALASARVAVCDWDVRTKDSRWSAGAAQVFGLGPGEFEVSFDAYLDHVHPEDREALEEAIRVSVDTGAELDFEHRVIASDGSVRWVVGRARMVRDGGGSVSRLIGAVTDVTERHLGDAERLRLLDELRQGQKMEAIGRLAAGVAHDFNNHLTIIRAAAELLKQQPDPGAATRSAIESIDEATQSAAALTKQLLTFSRGQAVKVSSLDLNQVIGDGVALFRRLLPHDVKLEVEFAPEVPRVRGDRGQLEQVLLNLMVNARDAMPRGGRLTVTTLADHDHADLVVRDTGTGMTKDLQAHIFEPFFTTKTETGGTGLGLSTTYGIVKQLGGSIEVDSAPGAGSAFTLHLPLA